MYCRKCGKENDDKFWKCEACGELLHDIEMTERRRIKPKNYLFLSVLLLLSAVPTAIISIIYGLKVNSFFNSGKYDEAEKYSKKTRFWVWISFIIGLIMTLVIIKYLNNFIGQYNTLLNEQMQDILRHQ